MKKLLFMVLILSFALPAYARRTDMMGSYGFGASSGDDRITSSNYHPTKRRYQIRNYRNNRYDKNLYNSKAAQMLYENEHYKNTIDYYRYQKELRLIDIERRKRELERRR